MKKKSSKTTKSKTSRQSETWSSYLLNRNVRPKRFTLTVERQGPSAYRIVGNTTFMFDNVNQYTSEVVAVDARDFARALNNDTITAS